MGKKRRRNAGPADNGRGSSAPADVLLKAVTAAAVLLVSAHVMQQ